MSRATSEDCTLLKNTIGPRVTGSYVRNVAIKLEEQISESGSGGTLLHTQRLDNIHISFSLRGQPGTDHGWEGTLCNRADDSALENATNSAYDTNDESHTHNASDAESISSSVVLKFTSRVQPASFVPSNADRQSTPIRSNANLKMAACGHLPIETSSANTSAASSFRSGKYLTLFHVSCLLIFSFLASVFHCREIAMIL